jgi:hypothetical protein
MDRLGVVGDRALVIAFVPKGERALKVGGAFQARIKPDRLAEVRNGAIEIAFGSVGIAAIVEGKGVLGFVVPPLWGFVDGRN